MIDPKDLYRIRALELAPAENTEQVRWKGELLMEASALVELKLRRQQEAEKAVKSAQAATADHGGTAPAATKATCPRRRRNK